MRVTATIYHDHTIEKDMIEFHVDDHPSLQDLANKKHPVFGGGMNDQSPAGAKPIIVLSQDEAVFNANSMSTKQWVGLNRERSILPKNNGLGRMVSTFQSRDLGWGMVLPRESIQQINDKRRGEAYFDRVAAKAVSDCELKKGLIESPLVGTFDYGGSKGYWMGNNNIQ
jgi:hypothetical protein